MEGKTYLKKQKVSVSDQVGEPYTPSGVSTPPGNKQT